MKRTLFSVVFAASLLTVAGCTIGGVEDNSASPSLSTTTVTVDADDSAGASEGNGSQGGSAAQESDDVNKQKVEGIVVPHGAVAVAGLGSASQLDFEVPAWSTIKVPISIAALQENSSLAPTAQQAIQQSDNDAAAQLWAALANPKADTEAVIAAGESSAAVQDQQVAPPYSPYGQTQWSVAEQANFASHLRCVAGSEQVVGWMQNIANGANYGLGLISGAIFKGGWGPNSQGTYGVRQFGLLPVDGEYVAVAIAATSPDGTYEGGQAVLNALAQNLQTELATMPRAAC